MSSSTSSSEPAASGSGRALALAAGLIAALAAALQVVDPVPPILTGSENSMQQYAELRAQTRRGERFDWIAVGSSFARQGVDPLVVSRASGEALRGFNFGAGGVSVTMLPEMIGLAYGVQRPGICLIVVPPPMLFTRSEIVRERAAILAASPYGVALGDPLRWRGRLARALLDHAAFARQRYAWKDFFLGRPPERWEPLPPQARFGYLQGTRSPDPAKPRFWGRLEAMLWGGVDEAAAARALVEAVEHARALGARSVIVAEGALHPGAVGRLERTGTSVEALRRLLRRAAEQSGARPWLLEGDASFPAHLFRDAKHLNAEGAERYSRWLGRSLPAAS